MPEDYLSIPGCAVGQTLIVSRIGILPIGSLEYHGPHLPLGTDSLIAVEVARRVAEEVDSVLLPPITYTAGYSSTASQGTVYVDGSVFVNYMCEVLRGILGSGLGGVLMLSAHGENGIYCCEAGRIVANEFSGKGVFFINWWDTVAHPEFVSEKARLHSIGEHDGLPLPGGYAEGSAIAKIAPEAIDLTEAADLECEQPWGHLQCFHSDGADALVNRVGYWGRLSQANAQAGESLLCEAALGIASLVKTLLSGQAG